MPSAVTVSASRISLFHVAAQELGNPLQWYQSAALNGLSDPSLASFTSPVTLLLPAAAPSQQDGLPVLSA